MLNINEKQSMNECYICGTLNELDINESTTGDGRQYISGTAKVRVDQEVNGKVAENIIPVRMFAMRKKNDGTNNPTYDRILAYKDNFTSVAAADNPALASKVVFSGKFCNITENLWFDQSKNETRSSFQISSNFMNKKRDTDEEKATFELSGVVGKMRPELDRDGNETGRLIVDFVVIGYHGKADKIELVASDTARAHIEANWQVEDTVTVVGKINMVSKTVTWKEEQGFGEPVTRTRTESHRELVVTGGSAAGLEEALSYDKSDIAKALGDRKARIEEVREKAKNKPASSSPVTDFNF